MDFIHLQECQIGIGSGHQHFLLGTIDNFTSVHDGPKRMGDGKLGQPNQKNQNAKPSQNHFSLFSDNQIVPLS